MSLIEGMKSYPLSMNQKKNDLDKTLEKRAYKQAQGNQNEGLSRRNKKADNYLPEWSNDVWMIMVEKAIVNRDKTITF